MKIFLVRHAHAGEHGHRHGDDRSRPLTARGEGQAQGLVAALSGEDIHHVLSSPYLRCVQTVQPLAAARGLVVHNERLLAEGSDWRETLALVCDAPGPSVLCSQGDVIGGIVEELGSRGLVGTSELRWQKGSTWVLEVREGGVASAAYIPPSDAAAG